MKREKNTKYTSFYCVGISFRDANVDVRGQFSLDDAHQKQLLDGAAASGLKDIFIVSTCNRTEIYGFAEHPFQLIKLLCEHSNGTLEAFQKVGKVFINNEAVSHMFKVGAGLDSQILGDFEIITQLRQGFIFSKNNGLSNSYLERLISFVIQASKRVKTETKITTGATSVAYASVQYILQTVPDISGKKILLFGTGAIGRNTCKNLVKHTDAENITVINRSQDSAEQAGGKFNLTVKSFDDLTPEINKADILIVATGAPKPTIIKNMIAPSKDLLILDLSIPANVDPDIANNNSVSLVHLDALSQITNAAISHRKAQVPQAQAIIKEVEAEFNAWLETRKFAPVINALHTKLTLISEKEMHTQKKKYPKFDQKQAEILSQKIVQKITNRFANHLKENRTSQAESLNFISSVFQLENNLDE
ncbi:MAG: glutamyl-tRNA reductase [Robiginitomaculum sp.]|nr:glutamyl-tRNA reductase [Robiginitomaculum sp.]